MFEVKDGYHEEKSGDKKKLFLRRERTLTDRQKHMIRARDNFQCQFPEPHICNGHEQTLHVHHITPFGMATQVMGKTAEATDHPYNLVSVCEEIHIGGRRNPIDKILHPDVPQARREWAKGNRQAFNQMHEKRREAMERRKPYHRSDKDTEMKMIAHGNTFEAEKDGRFSMEDFKRAGKGRRTGPN